jgi:cytoskeletal protein RodZ
MFDNAALTNAVMPAANAVAPAAVSKKRGWLPLLTVLFLISYALMTMLIVEQGRTIESQRALIRELFRDSTELSAVKQAQVAHSAAEAQAPVAKSSVTQTPSTQAPSTQAPTKHIPSSQAAPQHEAQKQTQKPQFQMPTRPASDLVDADRSLLTI